MLSLYRQEVENRSDKEVKKMEIINIPNKNNYKYDFRVFTILLLFNCLLYSFVIVLLLSNKLEHLFPNIRTLFQEFKLLVWLNL